MKGYISKLETFGLVDGPGVRFVVFTQGCHLRCKFCHNPETWACEGGKEWTAEKLFERAWRYHNYWKDNGGITVSGGEPLVQAEFVKEFFRLAKEKGVHTTLDTAGQPFTTDEPFFKTFCELMEYTDLVMLDLKHTDDEAHRRLTGRTNANILEMARWLSDHGKAMWIRRVLVPGISDDEDELRRCRAFIETLKTVERVEILPYHTLALGKWKELGFAYPLDGVPTPTAEQVRQAEELLGITPTEPPSKAADVLSPKCC